MKNRKRSLSRSLRRGSQLLVIDDLKVEETYKIVNVPKKSKAACRHEFRNKELKFGELLKGTPRKKETEK